MLHNRGARFAEGRGAPLTRSRIALLIGIHFAGFTLTGQLFPYLALYVQDLGVDDPSTVILWTGLLAGVGSAGLAAGTPLWAGLGRRLGLRAMLVRVLVGLAVTALMMAVVAEVWQLLLVRILQGVLGTAGTVVVAMVAGALAHEQRARVLGWLQLAMMAGSVVGPVLGGLVLYWAGFGMLFRLTAGVALAVAALALLTMPRVDPDAEPEITDEPPAGSVARDPGALGMAIYFLAIQVAAMMSGALLVLYVQDFGAGDATAPLTGLLIGSTGLVAGLAAPLAGRFRTKLGSAGGMGLTGGLAGLLLLGQGLATALGAVWVLRLGQGVVIGILRPSAQSGVYRLVKPGRRWRAYGFVARASTLGSIAGGLLGGVIGAAGGVGMAFAVAGGVLVVGTVAPVALVRLRGGRDLPGG